MLIYYPCIYLFAIDVVPLIVVGFVITWFCKDEREHEWEQRGQQQWQCGDFAAEHMARGCATVAQLSSPTGISISIICLSVSASLHDPVATRFGGAAGPTVGSNCAAQ
jgi:hypothetical protein